MASVAKELHRLIRRVGKLTDGQASVCDLDWEDGEVDSFIVEIRPNSGCFKGGIFKFRIFIPSDYDSDEPPTVHCETDIYHPNIDTTDLEYDTTGCNVCLNLLDKGTWSRKFGLEGVIIGLVFLIYNPNLADPLTPDFDGGITMEDFEENVKKYMRGEDVDERTFSADFLNNVQSGANDCADPAECHESTTTENCDKDNEIKDNQKDEVKERETARENGEDKIDIKNSEEHISTTDSVTNSENQAENQNREPVQSVTTNEINTNSESDSDKLVTPTGACENTERNVQENLLKQLEETGFKNENDLNDDRDGCTTITIDEEVVLVACDQAQLQQEEICEKQTVEENSNYDQITEEQAGCDQVTEEQRTGATGEKSSEDTKDAFSSVHSIIEELIENTINICSDEDKTYNADLPVFNLQTNENSVTDVHDVRDHAFENDSVASNSNNGGAAANGNEIQTVINKEAFLGKHTFLRQKSRESVKTQVNALNICAPYLKFLILHAFRCLTKL